MEVPIISRRQDYMCVHIRLDSANNIRPYKFYIEYGTVITKRS